MKVSCCGLVSYRMVASADFEDMLLMFTSL